MANELLDEVLTVQTALAEAAKYGLEAEVITTAFKHMQDNPGCSIDSALYAGLASWDI